MSEITQGGDRGLLQSLTALAGTLVSIAHTRLDLLSSDLEEEREHLISLLMLAVATLFFLGVGLVLATILLVVAFWDTHRLLVLGELTGFFLVIGLAAWLRIMRQVKTKPKLFSTSLAELYNDRQQLNARL